MNSKLKTALIWISLVLIFAALTIALNKNEQTSEVPLQTFLQAAEQHDVKNYSFVTEGLQFRRHSTSGRFLARVRMTKEVWTKELAAKLTNGGAVYETPQQKEQNRWRDVAVAVVIVLVGIAVFLWILVKIGKGQNQNIFALRSSKARLAEDSSKVKFDDVGGCTEAKQELFDLVDFLKSPKRWTDAGARLPRGVLLEGAPGSGKTLLARAVAGETSAKFYYTSASEFVEMFVGVGAARVRDMFETAKKNAPAVLFIDELDAIGRRRGSGVGLGNEEREQTLNQILVCMDGFESNDRVVVIAATNRSDILDKALVRAGRFDRRIKLPPFTHDERIAVLEIHTREKPLDPEVSLSEIANWTDGFSGADLEGLANVAALMAVRRTREKSDALAIQTEDFRSALRQRNQHQRTFDALDAVLFEATTQLAEPTGRAVVRITLHNQSTVEGEVVWVDPNFVKVRRTAEDSTCIVPKAQISQMESLSGTVSIAADNVQVDRSLGSGSNFA